MQFIPTRFVEQNEIAGHKITSAKYDERTERNFIVDESRKW